MTDFAALSLRDRAEIADLVQRYAWAVDSRDFDGVARLFTPEAVLVAPAPPQELGPARELLGPQAIRAELAQLTAFDTTVHGLHGHLVSPGERPDQARGQVRCEAHHLSTHEGTVRDLVWLLRYADTYARSNGAWLFARREITVDVIDLRTVKRVKSRNG